MEHKVVKNVRNVVDTNIIAPSNVKIVEVTSLFKAHLIAPSKK
jgi:hypothetical protein